MSVVNFLDAHKIFHIYGKVFADGKQRSDALLRIPRSALPLSGDNWKDEVIQANQIFFAHMILWNTRSQEFLDQSIMLLRQIDFFTDDYIVEGIARDFHLMEKEKSLYGKFHKKDIEAAKKRCFAYSPDFLVCPYRMNDVDDVLTSMISYKENIFLPKFKNAKQRHTSREMLVYDYCKRAYEVSHIPFLETDINFFWPFKLLRSWLQDDNMKNFFLGYEDYIKTNE